MDFISLYQTNANWDPAALKWSTNFLKSTDNPQKVLKSGHGNRFVTSEPKLLYLKSPGVKFMNHFTDLKNPLLKSFGSYKV